MQDILMRYSRQERRQILKDEQRARSTGKWGPWEVVPVTPDMMGGRGWTREITRAHRNGVFCVLERQLPSGVVHLAVTSASQQRPTWWEMQRIKNELGSETATAVEVYPPQSEVVDGADMFHIWLLPKPLSFSLYWKPRD
ncbi:hypothetical protein MAXJ12_08384 [Mesorhizobium alhagi CCNWXJ12-2]|uniref:DUF7694 domain-containing protein n=2 Tax=Allomesorhizobium alhagi TaxID=475067 RepID=H0HNF4_9HYPH|nr:hypothetical protein MAXJ12_08384 [Mesorhizobium alhagi CCNWXJ12-2]